MISPLETVCFSAIAFTIFYLAHFLIWRRLPTSRQNLKGVNLLTLLSVIVIIGILWVHSMTTQINAFRMFFVLAPPYFFLIMLYLHLYAAVDRSLSIKILADLALSPVSEISSKDLAEKYLGGKAVDARIELLVRKGLLIEENGVFTCSPKGCLMAKVALFFQKAYDTEYAG